MDPAALLTDGFGRISQVVHRSVAGLSADQLATRPADDANSIAWLIWHLTRIQDDHVADVARTEQVWTEAGWAERFGLPFEAAATGYGQRPEQVAAVRVTSDLLAGYYDAVHERTIGYISALGGTDLDRIVDTAWDPPVSLGVRLISVLSDDLQHAGQAAYLRGLLSEG